MSNHALVFGSGWVIRLGMKQVLRRIGFTVLAEGDDFGSISQRALTDRPALIVGLAVAPYDRGQLVSDLLLARTAYPDVPQVLVASMVTTETLDDASRAGSDGLLGLTMPSKLLLSSLELIVHGQKLFPGSLQAAPIEPDEPSWCVKPSHASGCAAPDHTAFPLTSLPTSPPEIKSKNGGMAPSEREWEILNCLAAGGSNKAIARELGIAETTVKVHVKSVLRKLRLSNRTQAAVWVHHNQKVVAPVFGSMGAVAVPAL